MFDPDAVDDPLTGDAPITAGELLARRLEPVRRRLRSVLSAWYALTRHSLQPVDCARLREWELALRERVAATEQVFSLIDGLLRRGGPIRRDTLERLASGAEQSGMALADLYQELRAARLSGNLREGHELLKQTAEDAVATLLQLFEGHARHQFGLGPLPLLGYRFQFPVAARLAPLALWIERHEPEQAEWADLDNERPPPRGGNLPVGY